MDIIKIIFLIAVSLHVSWCILIGIIKFFQHYKVQYVLKKIGYYVFGFIVIVTLISPSFFALYFAYYFYGITSSIRLLIVAGLCSIQMVLYMLILDKN